MGGYVCLVVVLGTDIPENFFIRNRHELETREL